MATPNSVAEDATVANQLIENLNRDPAQAAAPNDAEAGKDSKDDPKPDEQSTVQPDEAGVQHDWKARFTNLQTANQHTINQLKHDAEASQQREAELKAKLFDLEQQAAAQAPPDRSFLSEDDIELFGEDNLAVVDKIAQKRAEELFDRMVAKWNLEREQEATITQQQTTQERYKAQVTAKLQEVISDFDAIDGSPQFAAWMKEADPLSGTPRQMLMAKAFNTGDIGRIAGFYTEFKAATKPPADPRESKVTPKPSGAPASTDPAQGRIWTRAEITAFYHAKSAGKFPGTPEEARAIELDIADAQKTGRIR